MAVSDSYRMTFGKYKGEKIGAVPASYLDWISGQSWVKKYADVQQYITDNRDHIDRELEEEECDAEWHDQF